MKKPIFILIVAVITRALFAQTGHPNIYYHYKNLLYKGGALIQVNVNDRLYNVFNGIVSRNGEYVSGIILDERAKKYVETLNMPGIVDFFNPDTMTYVIYSLKEEKSLFSFKKTTSPNYEFSENGKQFAIYDYNLIEVYSKEDSSLKIIYKGIYEQPIMSGKYIIFLDSLRQRRLYDLERYSFIKEEPLSDITADNTLLIDSLRHINFKYRTAGLERASLYKDNKLEGEWDMSAGSIKISIGHIFLYGFLEESRNIGLYYFDISANYFNRIFFLKDFQNWVNDNIIHELFDFQFHKNILYFRVNSLFEELNAVYSYNMETKSFSKLTLSGISKAPMSVTD